MRYCDGRVSASWCQLTGLGGRLTLLVDSTGEPLRGEETLDSVTVDIVVRRVEIVDTGA